MDAEYRNQRLALILEHMRANPQTEIGLDCRTTNALIISADTLTPFLFEIQRWDDFI